MDPEIADGLIRCKDMNVAYARLIEIMRKPDLDEAAKHLYRGLHLDVLCVEHDETYVLEHGDELTPIPTDRHNYSLLDLIEVDREQMIADIEEQGFHQDTAFRTTVVSWGKGYAGMQRNDTTGFNRSEIQLAKDYGFVLKQLGF